MYMAGDNLSRPLRILLQRRVIDAPNPVGINLYKAEKSTLTTTHRQTGGTASGPNNPKHAQRSITIARPTPSTPQASLSSC